MPDGAAGPGPSSGDFGPRGAGPSGSGTGVFGSGDGEDHGGFPVYGFQMGQTTKGAGDGVDVLLKGAHKYAEAGEVVYM